MNRNLVKIKHITDDVKTDASKFDELFEYIFEKDIKLAWHAAWVVEKIIEKESSRISEEKIIRLFLYFPAIKNSSLQRAVLSVLIHLPLPENLPVEFINACFEKMISMKILVAVQALSMMMLERIAEKEPDFIPEILVTLENVDLTTVSAGYLATRKKVMKSLRAKLRL